MPQIRSNVKSHQITLRNRRRNKKYKSAIKIAIKQYLLSVENDKSKKENENICQNHLSLVYKKIDKAVKRKVLHKNTASRKKARLAKIIK
uniref:Small ribosomal subunit protein bS20c n=1 Tax=Rhodomela confervoides TaxID=35163 RepID=A0A1Z1MAC2_RHOCN|nr:ribosomal protein S20 [Rhodomela confervoides]ARW62694.1 ribosomal protein S20 [Rhodomela confervoides]